MISLTKDIGLTKDDTLKNILIMAPMLDEAGQNRVFGLMCGLIANVEVPEDVDNKRAVRTG